MKGAAKAALAFVAGSLLLLGGLSAGSERGASQDPSETSETGGSAPGSKSGASCFPADARHLDLFFFETEGIGKIPQEAMGCVDEMFRRLDRDSSGTLTCDEVEPSMRRWEERPIDLDGDCRVSRQEYRYSFLRLSKQVMPKEDLEAGWVLSRAEALTGLGQRPKAIALLRTAIEAAPSHDMLYPELSRLLEEDGRLEEAADVCASYLRRYGSESSDADVAIRHRLEEVERAIEARRAAPAPPRGESERPEESSTEAAR